MKHLSLSAMLVAGMTAQSLAECNLKDGSVSYLDGRGQGTIVRDAKGLTIELIWEDGDTYLFHVEQTGQRLLGEWALVRENGRPVEPDFRPYDGKVNPDCSFVATNAERSAGRNINGTVIIPK